VRYLSGAPVKIGDVVQIADARCTVKRMIPAPDGSAYIVSVTIEGLGKMEHGVFASVFENYLPQNLKSNEPNRLNTMIIDRHWRKMSNGALSFIESECGNCGSDLTSVFTGSGNKFLWDGDPIICSDCGLKGCISVVDGEAFCAWDDSE